MGRQGLDELGLDFDLRNDRTCSETIVGGDCASRDDKGRKQIFNSSLRVSLSTSSTGIECGGPESSVDLRLEIDGGNGTLAGIVSSTGRVRG